MHKTLVAPATVRVKAAGDGTPEGVVEALVSVFGNVDLVGDRVMPGAFTEFVDKVKGGWLAPFVWSHQTHSPECFIGDTIDAEETSEGLKVTAQLHLDEPLAAKVFRLIEKRQVAKYSFSYDIDEAGDVTEDGERVQELRKLTVHESGPTMYGANPATDTLATKALAKAGRVLSKANEQKLRDAVAAITAVLDQVASDDDDGKTGAAPESKSTRPAEDGEDGKSTEGPPEGEAAPPPQPGSDELLDAVTDLELDVLALDV